MNWGYKIACTLLIFMLSIIGAGIYMVSHNTDSLEEDDYYERSIDYDTIYEGKQNVLNFAAQPLIEVRNDTLFIEFKERKNQGQLRLKRPSDGQQDMSLPLQTMTGSYRLPLDSFQKGTWNIELIWSANNTPFYSSKRLIF